MPTALITGAAHGLGACMAEHAARRGYRVGVLDLDLEEARAVADPIGGIGLAADVTDAAQVEDAVERLGETPTLLINNAGILRTGPLMEHAVEDFRRVIQVNLVSVFIVSQIVARRMQDNGGGAIVNLASINAINPSTECGAYAAAKAGIVCLTQQMSREWGEYGIRVNSMAPGFIDSGMAAPFLPESRDSGAARQCRPPGTDRLGGRRGGMRDVSGIGCGGLHHRPEHRDRRRRDQQRVDAVAARVATAAADARMKPIEGMSVLITGGGSGIGAGTAQYFCERGARITICGRRKDKIDTVAARLGKNCLSVQADVTREADRRRLVDATLEHGEGLDALVNNAGNMYRGAVEELDEQRLLDLFHSNVVAGMLLTGLCVEALSRQRRRGDLHRLHPQPPGLPGGIAVRGDQGRGRNAVPGAGRGTGPEEHPRQLRGPGGRADGNQSVRAGLFSEEEGAGTTGGDARPACAGPHRYGAGHRGSHRLPGVRGVDDGCGGRRRRWPRTRGDEGVKEGEAAGGTALRGSGPASVRRTGQASP